jgi:antitoxin (DNA-binding transcriptional repressor) of toxin-antitoxin stability system
MLFSVEEAQNRFEELVERALRGEEVLIGNPDRMAKLVPFRPRQFKHGILKDVLTAEGMPDFLEPMSEEDLHLWEGGDERSR